MYLAVKRTKSKRDPSPYLNRGEEEHFHGDISMKLQERILTRLCCNFIFGEIIFLGKIATLGILLSLTIYYCKRFLFFFFWFRLSYLCHANKFEKVENLVFFLEYFKN